jgi:hypothetical protein
LRRHHPEIVAAGGVLDLVDLSAEIGEDQGGERAREQAREIEDADVGEGAHQIPRENRHKSSRPRFTV